MSIRKAKPEDLDEIMDVFHQSVQNLASKDYSPDQLRVWQMGPIRERLAHAIDHQLFLVLLVDDLIAAFASLQDQHYLDYLYVHPDHVCKGYARRLVQELSKRAIYPISADVSLTARPVLARFGFETLRENKLLLDGVPISNYRMIKYRST